MIQGGGLPTTYHLKDDARNRESTKDCKILQKDINDEEHNRGAYDASVEEEGGRRGDSRDVDAPDDDQNQRDDACPA
jgi:hypothetical protein